MNSNRFSPMNGPLGLHFGPQKGQNSVKSSKMAAQCLSFKTIFTDIMTDLKIVLKKMGSLVKRYLCAEHAEYIRFS